jgi:hypothetical protein
MYEKKQEQTSRKTRLQSTDPPAHIVATYEMDTKGFVKHMNARHKEGIRPSTALPFDMDYRTEQAYRAYHRRLHLEHLPHYHDQDPPEAGIDRAIELIMENRDWGWKEIADIVGHVAAFPTGQLATRVDGVIIYHQDISEATDRLMEASRLARENIKTSAKAGRR